LKVFDRFELSKTIRANGNIETDVHCPRSSMHKKGPHEYAAHIESISYEKPSLIRQYAYQFLF
jgi:hypothetical protein